MSEKVSRRELAKLSGVPLATLGYMEEKGELVSERDGGKCQYDRELAEAILREKGRWCESLSVPVPGRVKTRKIVVRYAYSSNSPKTGKTVSSEDWFPMLAFEDETPETIRRRAGHLLRNCANAADYGDIKVSSEITSIVTATEWPSN